MKFAFISLITLTLVGCSGESAPPFLTAPDPPVPTTPGPPARPTTLTFLPVVVIEKGGEGACIPGATVEIVRGQGLGRSVTQTSAWVCSYWDPDYEASFDRLNAGEELTLRASASGYEAKQLTVIPKSGPQTAIAIELSRIQ
jgi:hypothetical protein